MTENSFSIGSVNFKLNKINALKQFHIVRRIAPIMAELIPLASKFAKLKPEEMQEEQLAAITPIMNGLARLPDVDANLVLMGLLNSVEMQQSTGNWAKIAMDDRLMFENLDLPILLQAAGRAFMYNMTGFFDVLPRIS